MARKAGKKFAERRAATDEHGGDTYGLNEVDDFASKRDKVLLDESSLGNQGLDNGDDLNPDSEEEEVLGMSDESSSEAGEDNEEEDDSDENLDGEQAYRKVFGRKLDSKGDLVDSGEGMLDNDNAWGTTKGDYYGADDIDDEETAKEVEREALRQKKKHLEELNINDYLDDELDDEWTKSAKEFDVGEFKGSTEREVGTTSIKDILNMDSETKRRHLQTLFPEFLPLSKELSQLSDVLKEMKSQEASEIVSLKILALSSYLGAISSYFGILLHELNNNEDFATMKDHPVMEMILTSKEVWRQASSLPNEISSVDDTPADNEDDLSTADEELKEFDQDKLAALEGGHSEGDVNKTLIEKEKIEDEYEDDEEDDDVDLDDFEEYVAASRISHKNKVKTDDAQPETEVDDYVEAEMADVDSQEKKARKRTLRFYTSKIDQNASKKMDKFKGDDDIPYKERFFERQQRLLEEARKRGLHGSKDTDLDTKDFGSDDEATSRSLNNESEKDFFNLTQRKRRDKKDARLQAHKTAVMAARDGKLAELSEDVGDAAKRAINYQILKNKGLTPKRKKDNRNSRVKKRKKYEKAQKKLKSVRAVYSGGQSGVYEGEKTGIKKNLTKSVKFKN